MAFEIAKVSVGCSEVYDLVIFLFLFFLIGEMAASVKGKGGVLFQLLRAVCRFGQRMVVSFPLASPQTMQYLLVPGMRSLKADYRELWGDSVMQSE